MRYDGRSIVGLSHESSRQLRRHMQMILQNLYYSLNPRLRLGETVAEPLRKFGIGNRRERLDAAGALLDRVGLAPEHVDRYPDVPPRVSGRGFLQGFP